MSHRKEMYIIGPTNCRLQYVYAMIFPKMYFWIHFKIEWPKEAIKDLYFGKHFLYLASFRKKKE